MKKLRIATRCSILALWQANHVKELLKKQYPKLTVELLKITTKGDKILDKSLSEIGGKGLFTKELEVALIEGRADLAVHSLKDMPFRVPIGLNLTTFLKRESPHDAFVSEKYDNINELPKGAVIGTASLRRAAQLLILRKDLTIKTIRGNIDTRIKKMQSGEYDAIILAKAGLKRASLTKHIKQIFNQNQMISAVSQGVMAIECKADNNELYELLAPFNDQATQTCILAERRMNAVLGGSCHFPIAGFAKIVSDSNSKEVQLELTGLVAAKDGSQYIKYFETGDINNPEKLGEQVANYLLANGGREILASINL